MAQVNKEQRNRTAFNADTMTTQLVDGIHEEGKASGKVIDLLVTCLVNAKLTEEGATGLGITAILHTAAKLVEPFKDDKGRVIATNDDIIRLRLNLRKACIKFNRLEQTRNKVAVTDQVDGRLYTIKCNDKLANTWSFETSVAHTPEVFTKATKAALEAMDVKAQVAAKRLTDSITAKGAAKLALTLEYVAVLAAMLEIDPQSLSDKLEAIYAQAGDEEEEREAA